MTDTLKNIITKPYKKLNNYEKDVVKSIDIVVKKLSEKIDNEIVEKFKALNN
jgi:hypothetical protein